MVSEMVLSKEFNFGSASMSSLLSIGGGLPISFKVERNHIFLPSLQGLRSLFKLFKLGFSAAISL